MKTTRLLVTLIALLGVWQGMFAENQAYAVLDDNGQLTFYYNENKPASGAYDIPWDPTNNPGWYQDRENILTAAFDASFSSYRLESAANMFQLCYKLTSIDFTNFNTESVTNMTNMFSYCYALSSLDLSTFNTSNVTNMAGMFQECTGLETLTLPQSINTEKVTDMGSMFWGCNKLSRLDLSGFDTENVTNMSYMFCECWKLGSLNLSSFNTSNVVDMNRMFKECKALQSITFSNNFNTSNVKKMEYMFIDCFALQSLNLSSFDTSQITNMEYMFSGCNSLTAIVLSSFDTSNVTNMQYMFNDCSSLGSLNLSSFDTSNVTTMRYMFQGCKTLTSLDLSNFDTSKVSNMSYMFQNCSKLTDLDLSNFNTSSLSSMAFMFSSCTELTSVNIKNFKQTSSIDANNMFSYCGELKEILCTNYWLVYSPYNYTSNMFYDCYSIIGGRGTTYHGSNYTYSRPDGGPDAPGYFTDAKPYAILSDGTLTFYYDLDMKTRTGTYFDYPTDNSAPGWTKTEYAGTITTVTFNSNFGNYDLLASTKALFCGLSNLTTINDIHNLPTSNVINMSEMFKGCSSLTSLNVSSFDVAKVTDMTEMFCGCTSLETIYCNNDWSANGNVTSSDDMFTGCQFAQGNNVTVAYAKPSADGGYFSIVKEAYAKRDANGTLTFYYDSDKASREGTTYSIPWTGDYPGWYYDSNNVYRVKFDESFSEYKLKTAHLIFAYLGNLYSITGFEHFNTEDITDMSEMFYNSYQLKSLDLRHFDVSSATNMDKMFAYCSGLNYIYCNDDWSASGNVTSSVDMFMGCSSLKGNKDDNEDDDYYNTIYDPDKVTVEYAKPIIDGGYFTRLEPYAVLEGTNLTFYYGGGKTYDANNYDFDWTNNGNWKTATNMATITTVTFDESFINNDELTSTADMFSGLTHLTTVNGIFNLNLSNITAMDRMFNGCSALTTIYCNDDWSERSVSSDDMFKGCTSLPGYNSSKVTVAYAKRIADGGYFTTYSVPYAVQNGNTLSFYFDDQMSIREGYIYELTWNECPDWMPELYEGEGGEEFGGEYEGAPSRKSTKAEDEIDEYDEPDVITAVIFDSSFAGYNGLTSTRNMFANMTSLATITGLEYLNTENVTDMSFMFYGCSSLTSLDLRSFNTSKVTNMTGMFSFIGPSYKDQLEEWYEPYENLLESNLASINLSSFDTRNVYDMSQMFLGCDKLTSLDLSNFNTANVRGMRSMFYGCSSLTDLDISSFNTANVRDMFGMFYGCSGLKSLDVTSFNTRYVNDMRFMFTECSGLTSLDVRNFNVEDVWNIGYMFAGCSSLVTIYCNDSWNEWGSFYDCKKLVGGQGTKYIEFDEDEDYPYGGYAHPDGGPSAPGFFTYKAIELTLSDDQDNSNTIAIYDHKEVASVTLSGRTLYTDGDWNTLCLPFSLTAEQLAASPLAGFSELRTLMEEGTTFNPATGTLTLNFTPATGDDAVTSIEAGIPYIIKWALQSTNIEDPTFTNVTICDVPEDERIIWTDDVSFIGTYDPQPLTSANSNILYLGAGNTLYYPSASMTINAFRAYFELNLTSSQQVKAINLNFGDEENGIFLMEDGRSKMEDAYFTLDGRRLLSQPITPGIYIHNGRRVLIK